MTKPSGLLECPFCGGETKIWNKNNNNRVGCCGINMSVEKWNTRPEPRLEDWDDEKVADMIIQVAMGHHDDISETDENNALECANKIKQTFSAPKLVELEYQKLAQFMMDEMGLDKEQAGTDAYLICSKFGQSPLKLPEKKNYTPNMDKPDFYGNLGDAKRLGWNACLDEVKRMNEGHASII